MPASNFPGGFAHGLNVQGLAVLNTHPGKVFWVDENGGGGSRGTFDRPITSIDAALSQCVAGRGDIIMVKPGHVENIIAAGGLVLDVAGVSIVGTGVGDDKAKIEWSTAAAADVDVTAENVTLANMWLYNNIADTTSAFAVAAGGDYFTMSGNRWTDGSNALDALIGVSLVAGANYFKFLNNDVRWYTGGSCTSVIITAGECIGLTLEGNTIIAPGDTALIAAHATAITGAPLFRNNTMYNFDATNGLCVQIHATTVATFVGERYGSGKANTVPASDVAASVCIDCMGIDAVNTSSLIWPGTATAWT